MQQKLTNVYNKENFLFSLINETDEAEGWYSIPLGHGLLASCSVILLILHDPEWLLELQLVKFNF